MNKQRVYIFIDVVNTAFWNRITSFLKNFWLLSPNRDKYPVFKITVAWQNTKKQLAPNLFIPQLFLFLNMLISEKSIEGIVLDVAPKVQRLTGWDCGLETLGVRLIRKDQLWDYVIKPAVERKKFDYKPRNALEKLALEAFKAMSSRFPLGLYEPDVGRLYLIPENLNELSKSGVSVIVGHELVHRCQHVGNPAFFDTLTELSRELVAEVNKYKAERDRLYGTKIREMARNILKGPKKFSDSVLKESTAILESDAGKKIQSLMTLVEGDASFVQHQLNRMFYQNAERLRPSTNAVLLRFSSEFSPVIRLKLEQYTLGSGFVKEVYKREGRESVNRLYKLDKESLDAKLAAYKAGLEKNDKNKRP